MPKPKLQGSERESSWYVLVCAEHGTPADIYGEVCDCIDRHAVRKVDIREVVPRSEAEALAEALEEAMLYAADRELTHLWSVVAPAFAAYRARHPKETP